MSDHEALNKLARLELGALAETHKMAASSRGGEDLAAAESCFSEGIARINSLPYK